MLYKQNQTAHLSDALFRNPTSEYRGTPFWAWNCQLDKNELLRQIDILQEMGFGGFHMHVRSGMATKYLSDEYMDLITGCIEKAKKQQMLAWLYDEDRWPSGAAGGIVTKEKKYRARFLRILPEELLWKSAEDDIFVAAFDITLDKNGCLLESKCIGKDTPAENKWYAFVAYNTPSEWFNNQTYVNTLDKPSIDRFIEVTHERYNQTVSEHFGETVPAIFCDEPQFARKGTLSFGNAKQEVALSWTPDLPDTFRAAYGQDLIAGIPELLWDLADGSPSQIRYHYHDHVTERFAEAFADNIGGWCSRHGIALTGHMMEEESLQSQTAMVGETMRCYRGFGIPGIDMLCNAYEFTTAKQAASAVHQYGKEAMLSELYGVTNWDFDFRGHKLQGDWQAALGVNVRVHHLAWVSMHGEAKRDYPAAINYQSPWYKEYSYIEDHFARVNTALTRGKPIIKVAVIHPIESYWLHWGPSEQTALVRGQLDDAFHNVTRWLLYGMIDFDFICESQLPNLCKEGSSPLKVGAMQYDTVLVPCCETLRDTTLERLEQFREAGGKLIFIGNAPKYENALPSARGEKLYAQSVTINLDQASVLNALQEFRTVEVRENSGAMTGDMVYQLRQDSDCRWLFLAHAKEPDALWNGIQEYSHNIPVKQHLVVKIKGEYALKLYDTLSGEIKEITYRHENGNTIFETDTYCYDSYLLRLEEGGNSVTIAAPAQKEFVLKRTPSVVPVTLSEPNVCICDMAEYSLDGEAFHEEEETIRINEACKKALGWPSSATVQPWVIPDEPAEHYVTLKYQVLSDMAFEKIQVALEDLETAKILWNGKPVANKAEGWFTDICIQTVTLPNVQKGKNELVITWPVTKRSHLEWCYLLGDFGVKVQGTRKTLTAPVKELGFGDVVPQGLPFYGGNITYHIPFKGKGDVLVSASQYHGALINAAVDGKFAGRIVFSPYELLLKELPEGEHTIDLTLFGSRVNCFGQLHCVMPENMTHYWYGPGAWRTTGAAWAYEYQLRSVGILAAPELKAEK